MELVEGFLNLNAKRPNWASAIPSFIWFIFNCVFGLFMEEVVMAFKCIKPTLEVAKLKKDKEYPEYKRLTDKETKLVQNFFNVLEEADHFALKMIYLESSVQLVFYLTLLVVNFHEEPLMELNYNEPTLNLASSKWILGLIWLFFKTLLSGYTTFSSIFRSLRKDTYKSTGSAPNIIQYISVVLSVLLELSFATIINFLLRS